MHNERKLLGGTGTLYSERSESTNEWHPVLRGFATLDFVDELGERRHFPSVSATFVKGFTSF